MRSILRLKSLGILAAVLLLCAALALPSAQAQQAERKGPPPTRADNVKEVLHGVELVDPYRWLEEQNAPETRAWIDAQNQYTQSLIGNLPGRAAIEKRLGELLKVDTVGVPMERGGRYFFSKRLANQDLSVLYVRKGLAGQDEVLVDPHPMSADHRTSVSFAGVSDDGTLAAYAVRQGGADEIAIRFLDVDSRKDLADQLPAARYFGIALKPDKSGFYYTRMDKEGPRVRYHAMGTDAARDAEIFGKGYGPEKIITSELTEDGRYLGIIVLHGASADRTEIYLQDVAKPGPLVIVVNDIDARFIPAVAGDKLLLWTNWKAPKGHVLSVALANPRREDWRELIAESDAVIEGVAAAAGRLFVEYTRNVSSQVKMFAADGKPLGEMPLPALGTLGGISGRWKSKEIFYGFSSFVIPTTIYRLDTGGGKPEVWARLNVPIESEKFEVKQVWFASKDGTKAPMFVLHRKGLKLDGSSPALLTAYGGFAVSLTPSFSARAVLWVERGGVYAVANLRGGAEFGEEWHKAGMKEKKQNVFDDFYAAAEWLIQNKYTSSEKLAISGGSNGGLLVGAALTQRPELFRAVVCSYPLLDMVRYHKFLVARFWVPEYGSSEDAEQFKYIRAYSPYHNVKPGTKYPAVLFVTGDADTRVDPLHARKMAALVQAATGSDRPVLLHYDTKAGHSGGRPVSKTIADTTDELGFLFWQLGGPQ
ncbi:MAG: S9 family peptidase [Acidobacteria bacterium]|nr:S9 family peptidase [Acidobacteriota bacterium]MBI3661549.1 S9 family peptidase [Acidobacteriota bacterium]